LIDLKGLICLGSFSETFKATSLTILISNFHQTES
jgi:hypothetical protein